MRTRTRLTLAALLFAVFNFSSLSWSASVRTPVQTDNFTDNDLTAGSVTWTQVNSGVSHMQNTGGTVSSIHGGESVISADGTYSNDQYSKLKIIALQNFDVYAIAVIVRASTGVGAARDHYEYRTGGSTGATILSRVDNAAHTVLDTTTGVTWANGDTIELEVQDVAGTPTLKGYQSGILRVTFSDPGGLATGKPGVAIWNNLVEGDDWEGGNVTAAASTCRRALVGVGC